MVKNYFQCRYNFQSVSGIAILVSIRAVVSVVLATNETIWFCFSKFIWLQINLSIPQSKSKYCSDNFQICFQNQNTVLTFFKSAFKIKIKGNYFIVQLNCWVIFNTERKQLYAEDFFFCFESEAMRINMTNVVGHWMAKTFGTNKESALQAGQWG